MSGTIVTTTGEDLPHPAVPPEQPSDADVLKGNGLRSTQGGVLYSRGPSGYRILPAGEPGQVLVTHGPDVDPTWELVTVDGGELGFDVATQTELVTALQSGPATLTYNADGTLASATTPASTVDTIVYDSQGRMSSFRETVGAVVTTRSLTYDAFGNLATVS